MPSCGVDSVPSDAIVHLARKTLGNAPLGTSTTAATLRGGVPGGTIASFVSTFEDVPPNHLAMALADWSLSPVLGAPAPPRRLVYRLDGGIVGAIWVMGRINRALVQRTAGLLERARRETPRGREAREGDPACYGPSFTYTEFMPTGGAVSACLVSVGVMVTFAALACVAPVCVFFLFSFCRLVSDRIRIDHSLLLFTVAVAVQAFGDAARIRTSRPVRSRSFFFLASLLYGCASC